MPWFVRPCHGCCARAVDHYYLPLDRQPKYQARQDRGDVDYDSIESMDVKLVQVGTTRPDRARLGPTRTDAGGTGLARSSDRLGPTRTDSDRLGPSGLTRTDSDRADRLGPTRTAADRPGGVGGDAGGGRASR